MPAEQKQLEVLDDSNLSPGLGDNPKVPFPATKYVNKLFFTVELGTVEDDSGTEQSWNGDAEVDIFDSVKLNVNGVKWDIPGELIEWENVYRDGRAVKTQLEVDLRTTYIQSNGERIVTGAIRGGDYSTAQVEFELDDTTNLSSNGTQQDGTNIVVSGLLTRDGDDTALKNMNESVEQIASGRDQFDIKETGQTRTVIFQEDGNLSLDDLEAVLYTDDNEYEITDERVSVIRERNEKSAGADLPGTFFKVDVGNVDFSDESVEFIRVKTQASSSGKLTIYTSGARA